MSFSFLNIIINVFAPGNQEKPNSNQGCYSYSIVFIAKTEAFLSIGPNSIESIVTIL